MKNLILYDLKRRLRNPVTFILIWLIFVVSYIEIEGIKAERLERPFSTNYNIEIIEYDAGTKNEFNWPESISKKTSSIKSNIAQKILEADRVKDFNSINKYYTFYKLIQAKEYMPYEEKIKYEAAEKEIKEIWHNVSDGIEYEEVDMDYANSRHYLKEFSIINEAKFYNYLYNNDLEVFYKDDLNNISFSYNYLIDILPMLLIIIPTLLTYNIINREINNKSIKLVITQGSPRWKYYISKYITGVLHVLYVSYMPLVLINIILVLKYDFVSLKYPVFYYPLGFKSFIPRHNYIEGLAYPYEYISISRLPRQKARGFETILLGDELIPFYRFLLLSILFTVLFILFTVALVELISSITNNELFSFALTSGIFIAGYKLSEPFIHEKYYNISPFTMNNSVAIINGSCNATALTSLMILSSSSIALIVLGIKYFKRKEI